MAIETYEELDLAKIQKELNVSPRRISNLAISRDVLNDIYLSFQTSRKTLEELRAEILSLLNEKLSGCVHSVRCRIKDKDHLIEKIIRNVNERPEKYSGICKDNYNKIITDLIGVRIIILDKRDWFEVHQSLLEIFENDPQKYAVCSRDIIENFDKYSAKNRQRQESYHAEKPVVYITSEDDREIYKDDSLRIDNSKTHYRSIHYIIRYKNIYFEIQVRTLFEEGWLEFDHRIKYPYDRNNKAKQEYAGILSSLAVAADRLISFYNEDDFVKDKETDNIEVVESVACKEIQTQQSLEDKMKSMF